MPKKPDAPVLLVRWYDYTKWLLERVDSFPKNQRFIFGTRLADTVLAIMELLVEASYSRTKLELLRRANVKIEQLRWMIRLAKDRAVLMLWKKTAPDRPAPSFIRRNQRKIDAMIGIMSKNQRLTKMQ